MKSISKSVTLESSMEFTEIKSTRKIFRVKMELQNFKKNIDQHPFHIWDTYI